MTFEILNNWKKRRHFSHGFWIRAGLMFPWKDIKFVQVGFFGFIILLTYKKTI